MTRAIKRRFSSNRGVGIEDALYKQDISAWANKSASATCGAAEPKCVEAADIYRYQSTVDLLKWRHFAN